MTVRLCQKTIKVRHKFSLRAKTLQRFLPLCRETPGTVGKKAAACVIQVWILFSCVQKTARKALAQPLWLESHALLCLSLSSCFLSLAPTLPAPSCTCLALAPIERFTRGELWVWGIVCLLLDINASTPSMTFMLPLQAFASFPNVPGKWMWYFQTVLISRRYTADTAICKVCTSVWLFSKKNLIFGNLCCLLFWKTIFN